jgi:outer membrane immunogenic protein
MQRKLLASTALTASTTLITGATWAADMPVKAPPKPVPVPFSWSGCYAGVNAGAAFTSIDQNFTIPGFFAIDASGDQTSFVGGGQLGCNWQFDPHWVLGFEGDIDYLRAGRARNFAFHTNLFSGEDLVGAQQTTLRWFGTVRGKFGYVWDRAVYYATGGLAFGRVDSSATVSVPMITPTPVLSGSHSVTRVGWAGGGGVLYPITDRIFGSFEYLYFDLGRVNSSVVQTSGTTDVDFSTTGMASAKVTGSIVRIGIDVKFTP